MWRAVALGALGLVCGAAGAVTRVQPAPPVSSELPTAPEEAQARRDVIDEPLSEAQQRQLDVPLELEARIGAVDTRTNQLTLQTAQGPVLLQMPSDTQVRYGNQQVQDLAQLPEGKEVRASYGQQGDQPTLQLIPVNPPPAHRTP